MRLPAHILSLGIHTAKIVRRIETAPFLTQSVIADSTVDRLRNAAAEAQYVLTANKQINKPEIKLHNQLVNDVQIRIVRGNFVSNLS
jgi:hypothetical protein